MLNKALYLIDAQDTFAAVDYMNSVGSPIDVVSQYSELVRHLYWKEKKLVPMLAMARAGIQFGLQYNTDDVRGVARSIAYNLASFTWRGWDVSDWPLDATALAIGLDAARASTRLAQELAESDLVKSRAHWMLAAQLLAHDNMPLARQHFYRAAIYANRSDHMEEVLAARAFAMLTKGAEDEFKEIADQLLKLPNGTARMEQIRTAQRVFNLWFSDTTQASEENITTLIQKD